MEWMLMPLRRYADFSGRSRRKEYWMFALFIFLVYLVFGALLVALGAGAIMSAANGGGAGGFGALGGGLILGFGLLGLFWLAILIPSIAVGVRRLHDTNRTGWWLLAPLVPNVLAAVAGDGVVAIILSVASVILSITLLVFYCLDGTPGPNRYGDSPKGVTVDGVFD